MAKGISRRKLFGAAGGAAVAAAGGYFLSRRLACPREPVNVVFIVSDAFRADRLGALRDGKTITPNLDAFASRAAVYQECYAPCSWTKTSMASILTGTYPPYNGVLRPDDTIPKNCDTVADMLKRNGYATYGVQTNPWLAPEAPTLDTHGTPVRQYGFHKGFDIYSHIEPGKRDKGVDQPAYADAESANGAVRRMLMRPFKPFFLYVHYMETHQPWIGFLPREFTGFYCSQRKGRSQGAIFNDDQKLIRKVFSTPRSQVSEAEQHRLYEVYDEAILYIDRMIAEMLGMIDDAVGLDNTLVIFTADHGDELYEHDRLGHAHTLFEEVLRVPLAVSGPGVRPGRIAGRVSNVNIYETIKAFVCPGDDGREVMGTPLLGVPAGSTRVEDDLVFAQLRSPAPQNDWKLTKLIRKDLQAAIISENNEGKLLDVRRYDLKSDPGEQAPLEGGDADWFVAEAARLVRDHGAFARKHNVAAAETSARWQRQFQNKQEEEAAEAVMTDEEKRLREQLRALGYFN